MKEKEACHYTDSVIYAMEQTVVYFRLKGAQICSQLGIGLTIDQFAALDAIYANKDKQICQRDLSKLLLKDRSNTGRILNILEESGFIKRELETKGNRPVKKIYLTEDGKKTYEENLQKIRKPFEQLFEDVSEEELELIKKTVEKLKNCLSKTTTIQI
jgi:DNA-binding MarR family transcriptional regulator